MQSISDQAGVMQLGFFASARHCKAAVLLRKESVISGRNVVSMFMDFLYTVPFQRRTSGITRLSPYVPPYLRILPLNTLHIFASTANLTSRTQVAFLYWKIKQITQ
ncbi:Hypothetical_protein [Hexamita inflata]|uniref:Hypothetical_protein n=1 Tax=Hexamita inflata TaxID=28002 RepID=A0AA86Q4J5_9EUKA|nr:Hypothetical protein HINF_LOCUS39621 [Hexamita inflata]